MKIYHWIKICFLEVSLLEGVSFVFFYLKHTSHPSHLIKSPSSVLLTILFTKSQHLTNATQKKIRANKKLPIIVQKEEHRLRNCLLRKNTTKH